MKTKIENIYNENKVAYLLSDNEKYENKRFHTKFVLEIDGEVVEKFGNSLREIGWQLPEPEFIKKIKNLLRNSKYFKEDGKVFLRYIDKESLSIIEEETAFLWRETETTRKDRHDSGFGGIYSQQEFTGVTTSYIPEKYEDTEIISSKKLNVSAIDVFNYIKGKEIMSDDTLDIIEEFANANLDTFSHKEDPFDHGLKLKTFQIIWGENRSYKWDCELTNNFVNAIWE